MNKNQDIIISIGGSVIFSDTGINTQYLKELSILVRKQIAEKNRRFFIVIGGGHTEQEYQYTAERVVGKIKNEDLDWLGIHATRLNAHLIRTIFRDIAYPHVLVQYDKKPSVGDRKIVICAGWLPGTSTDFVLVNLAKLLKTKAVYLLLNVAGIYDRDPKIFKEAKPIERMHWSDYRDMIGDYWTPKRQLPFDPFAARLAQQINLTVIILEGKNIENLKNALEGKVYKGTIISN